MDERLSPREEGRAREGAREGKKGAPKEQNTYIKIPLCLLVFGCCAVRQLEPIYPSPF